MKHLRSVFIALILALSAIVVFAPTDSSATVSYLLPCQNAQAVGNGANSSSAFLGGACGPATPTPSPTPVPSTPSTPTPSPLASPTSFAQTVYMSDNVVDDMARVNAAYCADGANYGPMPSPSPAAQETDPPALMYLKVSGFRHIRDGYINCYNQSNYNAVYTSLHQYEGIGLMGTNSTGFAPGEITSMTVNNPAIEWLGMQNETDERTFPVAALTGAAVSAGATQLISNAYVRTDFVPGEEYQIQDGVFTENFIETGVIDGNTMTVQGAGPGGGLIFAHTSGTPLAAVFTYVQDDTDWLAYYAPEIRNLQPTFPIVGPSLAFPYNAQAFVNANLLLKGCNTTHTTAQLSTVCINAFDRHGYPNPDGSNPEGSTGDWSTGFASGSASVCNVAGMANSWGSNTCQMAQLIGLSNPNQYALPGNSLPIPTYQTEYSYHCAPVNSTYNSVFGPGELPDDVCAAYTSRSLLGALAHNVQGMYFFSLMTGTDGATGGFCTFGYIRTSNANGLTSCDPSNPKYPSTGTVATPQFTLINSLIRYFADMACKYPTCQFTPSTIYPSYSSPALPLNTFNIQRSDGRLSLVAWLGTTDYDYENTACRSGNVTCYDAAWTATQSETVTVPGMTAATLTSTDVTSTDPTPAPYNTTAPDGVSEYGVQLCHTLAESSFGCIKAATSLTVTNPGTATASVTYNVTPWLQWITPTFATPYTVTAAAPAATANPIVAGTPGVYPGAATPTAAPSPAPTSTTVENPTVQCITKATSGSAAPNKTFSFTLNCTPYFNDLLVAYVQATDTTYPAAAGSVTNDVPIGWKQLSVSGSNPGATYGGAFGQANLAYKTASGTESTVTITDPVSHAFWWAVTVYDIGNPGTVQTAMAAITNSTVTAPSITPTVANSLGIVFYGVQNADTGPATYPYWSIAASGWTMQWPFQTNTTYTNNIFQTSATQMFSGTAAIAPTATFSDSGGNLFVGGGVAATVVIAPGNFTVPGTATPAPSPTASQTPPPTPTPLPSSSPSIIAVSQSNSNSAAINKTYTGAFTAAGASHTLLVFVYESGNSTKPSGPGNVTTPTAPAGCTEIGSAKYSGSLGSSSIWSCASFAGETSLVFADPVSNQYNWSMLTTEIANPGTITCSTQATTSLAAGTPSLTPTKAGGFAFSLFGIQNSNTGAATSPSVALTNSGWTSVNAPQSTSISTGTNNVVSASAYEPFNSLTAISQTGTFAGTNLASSYGTAALCVVNHL